MPPNELSSASRLVSAIASDPLASNCSTTLAPAASRSASGTTSWTRPMRRGGSAPQHSPFPPERGGLPLGAETFTCQRVAADLPYADGIAELRDDDGRGQAPAHFGDREQGVVGRDHDVAGCDHAGAAAEAAALH